MNDNKLQIKQTLPDDVRQVLATATCLYTKQQVEAALDQMAKQISSQLRDSNPVFLCVVIGGMIPMGHLLTRLDFPLEVDYVHATRYCGKIKGEELLWKVKPATDISGRTVVIVDDILDAGLTLAAIVDYCRQQQAKEIFTAVLVEKDGARVDGGIQEANFTGLHVDNVYVFGYGMDYRNYLRNVPGIYAVAE